VTAYAVDLDRLGATVDSLSAQDARLTSLVDGLHARIAALHLTWTGLAASEHASAHREWEAGFADMRDGLAAMREAARAAHHHYREAARLNTSLWEQLR
jgi:WXG100 family type VII secretion target